MSVSPSTTRSAFRRAASAISGSYIRQLSAGVLPPLGLKWTVASRTVRGGGGLVSVIDTPLQRTVLSGAQRRCSSTIARDARAGA